MEKGYLSQHYFDAAGNADGSAAQLARQKLEFSDLQDEIAGRDNGKARRFISRDQDPREQSRKDRQDATQAAISALQARLADPEYRAAYERAHDAVDRAQAALDEALLENAEEIERLAIRAREMDEAAAQLPDGTAVFMDANGTLRTADGRRLGSEDIPSSLVIPADAPSYEDRAAVRDASEAARTRGAELAGIQTDVIDPARERLHDEDDPLELDELGEVADAMERARKSIATAGESPESEPVSDVAAAPMTLAELTP